MRILSVLLGALIAPNLLFAQPLWLRNAAISPDGQTIAFCYQGDIWRVPAMGGDAVPLTTNEAYDHSPVWSHDGKQIAFTSNRHGNADVFVMTASGGVPTRLTYHATVRWPATSARTTAR